PKNNLMNNREIKGPAWFLCLLILYLSLLLLIYSQVIYTNNLTGSKRLRVAFLSPYAPELNPQEYIWCRWKRNYMANFCPENLSSLTQRTKSTLGKLKSNTSSFETYWKQVGI
ncbi:hypothetical protein QMM95_13850, partial [Leptospira santarosai]|nr:hypothetical protein [Leptospira santarosai]